MKHLFILICLGLTMNATPGNAQIFLLKTLGKAAKNVIEKEINKSAPKAAKGLNGSTDSRSESISEPVNSSTVAYNDNEENSPLILTEDMLTKGELHNGHYYVDLGLPVMWATCNVGANSPSESGEYYSWCETSPKETYTKSNSPNYNHRNTEDIVKGNPKYDAARKNWGGKWRLPTAYELTFLKIKCEWKWARLNGQNGALLISKKNGNKIFLPSVFGCGENPSDKTRDTKNLKQGSYWSATVQGSSDAWEAYSLIFEVDELRRREIDIENHWDGLPVRPVIDK